MKKHNLFLVLSVVVALAVVVAGIFWYSRMRPRTPERTPQQTATVAGELDSSGYVIEYVRDENDNPRSLVLVSATGDRIPVRDEVAVKIDNVIRHAKKMSITGENLESPVYPTKDGIVYLATNEDLFAFDAESETVRRTVINRIYALREGVLSDAIYKEESVSGAPLDPESGRALWTMGMDGTKLVLFFQTPMNSPGPCVSPWYHYADSFGYLDLRDIAGGIRPYAVPAEKIAEEKAKAEECEKGIEAERQE